MSMATKRDSHQASVLNSNENQSRHREFCFQKDNLYHEFFLTPTTALSMQFNSFSFFLALRVDHETDTDVSFPTPINDAECKARFFVLDEASKESKLIAYN